MRQRVLKAPWHTDRDRTSYSWTELTFSFSAEAKQVSLWVLLSCKRGQLFHNFLLDCVLSDWQNEQTKMTNKITTSVLILCVGASHPHIKLERSTKEKTAWLLFCREYGEGCFACKFYWENMAQGKTDLWFKQFPATGPMSSNFGKGLPVFVCKGSKLVVNFHSQTTWRLRKWARSGNNTDRELLVQAFELLLRIFPFPGDKPNAEEAIIQDAMDRLNNNQLDFCTVQQVPGTFNYFGTCSQIVCIPLEFCLNSAW